MDAVAKSILATEVTPTLGIELPRFGGQGDRTAVAVMDAMVALGRATRGEGTASGMFRYSNFWFGDGPRPDPKAVMVEWLRTTANRSSCCDAHTEDHQPCGLEQAAAVSMAVFDAVNIPDADDAVRWQQVQAALFKLSAEMPH